MGSNAPVVDLLSGAPRLQIDSARALVVVAPHPDDEVIGFGGVLFDHVAAGGRVLIVSVTDGDAYDLAATSIERHAATTRRRNEQREALAILGIEEQAIVRLGVADNGVATDLSRVTEQLRALLRSYSPADVPIVVTPWRDDWHPDHVATCQAVRRCGIGEILEVPIWSWHRRHQQTPTWRELLVIPISSAARDAKHAALACHRSQLSPLPSGRPAILSSKFLSDFERTVEIAVR